MSEKTLRHRCRHQNRVEVRDGWGGVLLDYCPDCGAESPSWREKK